jgi:hypothetical protein
MVTNYCGIDGDVDLELARRTGQAYIYSGAWNPSVNPTKAPGGAIFMGNGTDPDTGEVTRGRLWQKQDDGCSTNWNEVSHGSIASLLYRYERWVDPIVGSDASGDGSINKPFKTVTACLASITDASLTNRYLIRAAAGDYSAEGVIAWKDDVSLLGSGKDVTRGLTVSVIGGADVTARVDFMRAQFNLLTLDLSLSANYNVRPIDCTLSIDVTTVGANNILAELCVFGQVRVRKGALRANNGSQILQSLTLDDDPSTMIIWTGGLMQGAGTVNGRSQVYLFNTLNTMTWTGVQVGANKPVFEADAASFPFTTLVSAQWSTIAQDTLCQQVNFQDIEPTIIYVDSNRTDDYKPNGKLNTPFKTIQAAINQVIANGDNSFDKPYKISVAPGSYPENVLLNDAKLVNLIFDGNDGASINPAAGYAMESSANNTNLSAMTVRGFSLEKPCLFQGDINNTNAFNFGFDWRECLFTGDLTFRNIGTFSIFTSEVAANVIVENVISGQINQQLLGNLTCTYTPLANQPNGSGPGVMFVILEQCVHLGNVVADNCQVQFRVGTRAVNPGNSVTLTNGGSLLSYSSFIRGNIVVNNGCTFTNRGSFFYPANLSVNAGGTFTNETFCKATQFNVSVPGNWIAPVPTDPETALNRIAAALVAHTGAPIP